MEGKTLILAINTVLAGNLYYSNSIIALLNNREHQNIIIDNLDLQLLIELSNGAKMKELQELLPLSKSGLDKRRRLLKEKFGIESHNDRDLVLTAKEKGFI